MTLSFMSSMVQLFEIDGNCLDKYPCNHSCKITYKDKNEETIILDGRYICSLIKDIGKDKVIGYHHHFRIYEEFSPTVISVYSYLFT